MIYLWSKALNFYEKYFKIIDLLEFILFIYSLFQFLEEAILQLYHLNQSSLPLNFNHSNKDEHLVLQRIFLSIISNLI